VILNQVCIAESGGTSVINDTAGASPAVSMTLLVRTSGFIDTAEALTLSNNFANLKPYAKRLKPVNQGPRWDCLMKKTRGQKSRDIVPLKVLYNEN
jgi:hypothetical protein